MKCAPKKFENPAKLFDPSEMSSVMVQTDTCQICAVPSVWDVGNAVGDGANGHVSDMRAENPSVMPSVLASERRR